MHIDSELIRAAIRKAAKGHAYKPEVREMLENIDEYTLKVASAVETGEYANMLSYREFETRNSNGKMRHIQQPSLFTRVLQHLFIVQAQPLYDALDPHLSYNCKKGYGVSANDPAKSVLHRVKSIMFDRRDLHYALHIDQRKCYEHMTRKLLRKSIFLLAGDRELADFGVNVTFNGKSFPIGTPTSPFAHHVMMLAFDRWLGSIPGPKLRYADDCLLFFRTKEEANEAKWRIRQFWWIECRVRAKRQNSRIVDIDREPLPFCGYIYRRNCGRTKLSHDKGYVVSRRNIRNAARKCRKDSSWSSYFGILSKTDSFRTMEAIEKAMQMSALTARYKIKTDFDGEPLNIYDLVGKTFDIHEFAMRPKKNKETGEMEADWVRLSVAVPETNDLGEPTGKQLKFVTKTTSKDVVQFLELIREAIARGEIKKENITECELENSMGLRFKGCTAREYYVTDGNMTMPDSSMVAAQKEAEMNAMSKSGGPEPQAGGAWGDPGVLAQSQFRQATPVQAQPSQFQYQPQPALTVNPQAQPGQPPHQ